MMEPIQHRNADAFLWEEMIMTENQTAAPLTLPLVSLRDVVIYPHMTASLDIGRKESIAAVRAASRDDRYLVMMMQKDPMNDAPKPGDLYEVGTVVKMKQLLQLPGGVLRILVEGVSRVRRLGTFRKGDAYYAEVEDLKEVPADAVLAEAYRRSLIQAFYRWLQMVKQNLPDEAAAELQAETDAGRTADFIASHLMVQADEKQKVLELPQVEPRLAQVRTLLDREMDIAEVEEKLNAETRERMEKDQRDYYLRQKIRTIHDELGDKASAEDDAAEYKEKLKTLVLPDGYRAKVEKEIARLASMPPMMAESAVIRNYLDWIFDLPWNKESEDNLDLHHAEDVLNEDHFGLKKIKERILEYLAVRILAPHAKAPILCFVGPPGVGKTSLAQSIARAVGKKFARISLGGIHDEAEIRGHRRTYIGAMPGRFIEAINQAKTRNPVILLDEIDKIGGDFRGDPASALLEALDPEQNKTFSDNYIEIPFDLSQVFFIATANTVSTIPAALLDRMEVISLTGYTEEEKMNIASMYLVKKQMKETGLTTKDVRFTPAILRKIIRSYTREAGVRNLERTIASLCRKVGKKIVMKDDTLPALTARTVEKYLGPVVYLPLAKEHRSEVGRVNGLAWTQAGGEVLDTEAVALKGKGKLILTGQLGDVMKESAEAAYTYIRSRAAELGLDDDFYEKLDIHIHLPEGAIPKDGPSAGITMATAMASAFTGRKVRGDTAMTGEITLTGDVLPIGGVKEKILAADQLGITQILLPEENKKDLEELPDPVRKKLHFVYVKNMDQVLEHALVK